jgi:hypothetical protein
MSRHGLVAGPTCKDETLLKSLDRRLKKNMTIATGFKKVKVLNTPEMYRYPRLFPGTDS